MDGISPNEGEVGKDLGFDVTKKELATIFGPNARVRRENDGGFAALVCLSPGQFYTESVWANVLLEPKSLIEAKRIAEAYPGRQMEGYKAKAVMVDGVPIVQSENNCYFVTTAPAEENLITTDIDNIHSAIVNTCGFDPESGIIIANTLQTVEDAYVVCHEIGHQLDPELGPEHAADFAEQTEEFNQLIKEHGREVVNNPRAMELWKYRVARETTANRLGVQMVKGKKEVDGGRGDPFSDDADLGKMKQALQVRMWVGNSGGENYLSMFENGFVNQLSQEELADVLRF